MKDNSPNIVKTIAKITDFRKGDIDESLHLKTLNKVTNKIPIITYSMVILKGVKPEPSMKQSGKKSNQIVKMNRALNAPHATKIIRSFNFGKNKMRKNPIVSNNLPAIQNCVGWFAVQPRKTPIPLYARVCKKSITATKKYRMPNFMKILF